MFEMEAAVREWRRGFATERGFSRHDLDELEDHLRAAYEVELVLNPALAPEHAFRGACETLGSATALSKEFAKVGGRGWRRLLKAGWLLFAVSFFLPVARYGITLGSGSFEDGLLPGIQALLIAMSGAGGVLGVLSGLTNLVMGASFWRIEDANRLRTRVLASLATLAAVLNLCWLVLGDDPSGLYAGYFTWLASFGVVGTGLWLRSRSLPVESASDRVIA